MSEENKLPDEAMRAIESIESTEEQTTPNNDVTPVVEETTVTEPLQSNEEDNTEAPAQEGWWTDGDLAHGQSYQLSEDSIKSFSSPEDFRNATRLLDQQLGTFKQVEQPAQSPESPAPKQEEVVSTFERVELDPDELDPTTIAAFNKLQDQLESVYKTNTDMVEKQRAFEAHQQEQFYVQRGKDFLEVVDSLGETELFGTDGNRSNVQQERLDGLWQKTFQLEKDIAAVGQHAPYNVVVNRTIQASYHDQLERQRQASSGAKIVKQSRQRLGGGQSTQDPPSTWNGEESTDPKLLQAYRDMVNENGTGY